MAEADRGGVAATHRVAHDRAVILVFDDAEFFLDIRDDVVEHLLLHAPTAWGDAETAATRTSAASRTSRRRRVSHRFLQREDLRLFAGGARLLVAEGHDDDRGNGLLVRDEVVHDGVGHAGLRPAELVVVGAM